MTSHSMRILSKASRWAMPAALGIGLGCASLDVSNPNAPDRTRALSQAGDVSSLVGGAFAAWYYGQQDYAPAVTAGTMASHISMSWGNFGARLYSSVPRIGFQNVATDINSNILTEIP